LRVIHNDHYLPTVLVGGSAITHTDHYDCQVTDPSSCQRGRPTSTNQHLFDCTRTDLLSVGRNVTFTLTLTFSVLLLMSDIYEVRRRDGMGCLDIHTKLQKHCLRH
jgi:hypothetical protein